MPELPEVENLRQGLGRTIVGQKIRRVEIRKPKLVSSKGTQRPASLQKKREFIRGTTGEKFISVERRAKNLIFELEKGTLYYNDTRMFGYLLFYPNTEAFLAENHFGLYGLEPLSKEFNLKYLVNALKNKKGKMKAVLMNQKIVTGLGNIYADETLFESKIRPERNASSISRLEAKKLYQAIIRIMQRATKVGGSSVAAYRLLDTTRGNYAREHKVYGKAGQMCVNCHKPLEKIIIQSRTTIFCPRCQK